MSDIFDDKIEATLKSIDGIAKASPKPFLLTRINAGLNNAVEETVWSKIAFYLKKPLVAGCAILLLALVNIIVIKSINKGSEKEIVAKSLTSQKYDFAIHVSVLYDIENQEP
jgi:hypothetical protein